MAIGDQYPYDYTEVRRPPDPVKPRMTISEIERLAKSGVAIKLDDVWPMSDPPPSKEEDRVDEAFSGKFNKLSRAIWYRWMRSREALASPNSSFHAETIHLPFHLLATQHGDTVWVSVHPTNFNYEPFQLTDTAVIFPSDALMAKLALWEKEHT